MHLIVAYFFISGLYLLKLYPHKLVFDKIVSQNSKLSTIWSWTMALFNVFEQCSVPPEVARARETNISYVCFFFFLSSLLCGCMFYGIALQTLDRCQLCIHLSLCLLYDTYQLYISQSLHTCFTVRLISPMVHLKLLHRINLPKTTARQFNCLLLL